MQMDKMTGTATVLEDDERFCDLQPLALVDEMGAAVALPDLSSGASWESCMGTAEAGLARMDAAHLSNQVRSHGSLSGSYFITFFTCDQVATVLALWILCMPIICRTKHKQWKLCCWSDEWRVESKRDAVCITCNVEELICSSLWTVLELTT
jgi:hypothetical protein